MEFAFYLENKDNFIYNKDITYFELKNTIWFEIIVNLNIRGECDE